MSHCLHNAGAQGLAAIASFVVDVQKQQNHIAHEALFQTPFQRGGNSEGCNGIDDQW